MTELAHEQLKDVLDALGSGDTTKALDVWNNDARLDNLYNSVFRELLTYMMEDPRMIPVSLNIMWAARALERVGDRSCNICEYVIYYAMGKNIRHISIDQVEKDLRSS
mgnify:CR=1 FL=1